MSGFTYLLLFAIQMFGSDFLVWKGLPAFRQLTLNPGEQPANTSYDSNTVVAVLFGMQGAYWYRFLRVAIPFRGPSLILSHLFLMLRRGVLLVISLFALFCFTLELERLGMALGETQRA